MIKMAKPIAATPTLEGKDAVKFLLEMLEPPTEKERKMLEDIKAKYLPILF
jgi:hypothetical protein